MRLRRALWYLRLALAQRLLPAQSATETWLAFGEDVASSTTRTGRGASSLPTPESLTSSPSAEEVTLEDEEEAELDIYFTCTECGRAQKEEPTVVGFRTMAAVEHTGGMSVIWAPEMKGLCDDCLTEVRLGSKPLQRPNGERVSGYHSNTHAFPVGFQAPEVEEDEGTEEYDQPPETVEEE